MIGLGCQLLKTKLLHNGINFNRGACAEIILQLAQRKKVNNNPATRYTVR